MSRSDREKARTRQTLRELRNLPPDDQRRVLFEALQESQKREQSLVSQVAVLENENQQLRYELKGCEQSFASITKDIQERGLPTQYALSNSVRYPAIAYTPEAVEEMKQKHTAVNNAMSAVNRNFDSLLWLTVGMKSGMERRPASDLLFNNRLDLELSSAAVELKRLSPPNIQEHPAFQGIMGVTHEFIEAIHLFWGHDGESTKLGRGDNGAALIAAVERNMGAKALFDQIAESMKKRGAPIKPERQYIAEWARELENMGYSTADQVAELLRRLKHDVLEADEQTALEGLERSGMKKLVEVERGKTRGQIDAEINKAREQYIRNCKRDYP